VSTDDPTDPRDATVARLLDDPTVWAEVPAGLRDRVVAAATGAVAGDLPDDGRPPAGPPASLDHHRRRRRRPVAVAVAAVALVCLGVAGGLVLARDDAPAARVEVAMAGTDEAPGATAVARLRDEPAGVSVRLTVEGLPPAPEGTFYEAWLVGEAGKVSAGTFHLRGEQDEIELWLGVDPTGYEAVTVTRQPVAGGTLADGVPVLRGELPSG
jgi:hypothetical protein